MGNSQMKRRDVLMTSLGAAALASISGKEAFASDLAAVTRTGGETTLTRAEIKEFADSLTYALLSPGTPRYDSARKVWNGIWDSRRPALIAQCADTDDVISAVNFARTHDLLVAVRGGGHSISGMSVCDGGLVIIYKINSICDWCALISFFTSRIGIIIGGIAVFIRGDRTGAKESIMFRI